jgi:membrane protease YdiL (CAAX protease family)
MFKLLSELNKAWIFYGLTFIMATLVALQAPTLGEGALILSMFTPTIAVLLMLLVITRDGYRRAGWADLGLHRWGWSGMGLAVFMPMVVLGSSYGLIWLTGLADVVPPSFASLARLPNFLIGLILTTSFSLVEEVGWRGYLLPRLLPLGTRRALLLNGLLHGLFHMPLMMLTTFYNSEGDRLIVIPIFLATFTAAGVFYGYLRLKTDSVWPAAVTHQVWNTIWETFTAMTVTGLPFVTAYLIGETGIVTLLSLVMVVFWLFKRLEQPTGQEQKRFTEHAVIEI